MTGWRSVGTAIGFCGAVAALSAQPPTRSPFASTRITHVGIVVRDVAASASAYADLFGVPVPPIATLRAVRFRSSYRGDKTAPRVAVIHLSNIDFELLQPQGGANPWREHLDTHGESIQHVGFAVPNVADAVAYMEDHGGRVLVGGGAGRSVTYVDCGNEFGAIVEPVDAAEFAARAVPKVPTGSFAANTAIHVSTIVRSAESASQSVARLFGLALEKVVSGGGGPGARGLSWPPTSSADRQAGVLHATYKLNDGIELELSEAVGGASPWREHLDKFGPSTHHVAFRVNDLAKTIAFLESKGGNVTLGGDGTVAYAYVDMKPFGFTFELNGPRPTTPPR